MVAEKNGGGRLQTRAAPAVADASPFGVDRRREDQFEEGSCAPR
jgi:hypothetical protein